jgi:hypothetical protein
MVNAPSPAPSNASAKSSSRQAEEGRKQFFFEKKAAPALREPKNFQFQAIRIVPGMSDLWRRRENKSLSCTPCPSRWRKWLS